MYVCYIIWPRNVLLASIFGHGTFFLRVAGFRDEHGLALRARLKADTALHMGTVFWILERDFVSVRNFFFFYSRFTVNFH
jgi:hypothetical protein